MATKRKLGYAARYTLKQIDLELVSGDKNLTPLIDGEPMLRGEVALRAALASRQLREARRMIADLLSESDHEADTPTP